MSGCILLLIPLWHLNLKMLESVSFFLGGKSQKVSKNSKHWSNEKGPSSSTTKIVQRNNYEKSNATSQCIWIQIFLFVIVIVIVLPICSTCYLSQQAKSAAADSLTYEDSIDKKVRKI
jgi:hypothetical protein